MVLQPASITPEPIKQPRLRNVRYCIRSRFSSKERNALSTASVRPKVSASYRFPKTEGGSTPPLARWADGRTARACLFPWSGSRPVRRESVLWSDIAPNVLSILDTLGQKMPILPVVEDFCLTPVDVLRTATRFERRPIVIILRSKQPLWPALPQTQPC